MVSQTVVEFLKYDPLAGLEHEMAAAEIRTRMPTPFVDGRSNDEILAFRPFVELKPWRYWSGEQALNARRLLLKDLSRTARSIGDRASALDRAFSAVFSLSQFDASDERLDHNRPAERVKIATELLPAYLRWTEHMFGNLLEVYWATAKKGSEKGRFDLKGATDQLEQRGHEDLLRGYDDRVRNGIAHGEVRFSFPDIHFGTSHPARYSSSEMLNLFDDLRRTVNALAVAVIDFWLTVEGTAATKRLNVPISMAVRIAAGGVNRDGLSLNGAVESQTPLAGRQLHVAAETADKRRTIVFGNMFRIATRLIEAGTWDFDRMLFGIEHGEAVQSLAILRPRELKKLLDNNAALERLPEALDEPQLLWFDESGLKVRWRIWMAAIQSAWAHAKQEMLAGWQSEGFLIGRAKYRVRGVENLSASGEARVRVIGVLKDPSIVDQNPEHVGEILRELVREGRKRRVPTRPSFLDKGPNWRKRPKHVYVDLYREDGPTRWLRSGGWLAGNLVAVGEKTWGRREHNLVEKPEQVYRGIRIRYSMDVEAAAEVLGRLQDLIKEVQERADKDGS